MKGLRLSVEVIIMFLVFCPNWPDLWRDCDTYRPWFVLTPLLVQIDLIYEGIATHVPLKRTTWVNNVRSKLTWFMKGLRRYDNSLFFVRSSFLSPNWPDLWRDCDLFSWFFSFYLSYRFVQIDLIYEGIATLRFRHLQSVCQESKLTWFMKGLRPKPPQWKYNHSPIRSKCVLPASVHASVGKIC